MKRTDLFNLIAGLVLVAFTATGFAAELLSSDLKLSAELQEYTLATESSTSESTKTGAEPAEVTVIVRYKTVPDQQEVNRLTTLDASTKRAYSRLPMRAIRVPVDKLGSLADDADVEYLSLDTPVEAFTEAARLIANEPVTIHGAPQFDGNGIGVAVIDSGVSGHDDIYTNGIEQYTFLNGANGTQTALVDDFGHGTHVAGIIATHAEQEQPDAARA